MQFANLDAHLDAERCVEVGQGFVKQEDARFAHNRPANRDALALAAGKLRGLALHQRAQLQHVGGPGGAPGHIVF